MTLEEAMKYEDVDFYHVEADERGKKWIHVNGYNYFVGEPEAKPWRYLEFTWLYLDPVQLREDENRDYYDQAQAQVTQYIEDLSDEEFIECVENLLEGCTHLYMEDVTDDTPEGWYVDSHQ